LARPSSGDRNAAVLDALTLHLVEYGYAFVETDEEPGSAPAGFTSTMSQVFERLLRQAGEPLWLGIVETIEPGSSAWMDVFGASVVTLCEGANWWPGTDRLSLGDARVRAISAEAFGRDWKQIEALVGEGFYEAFDPFLFRRGPVPGRDLCVLHTIGHEGMASCLVRKDDPGTGQWLESLDFWPAAGPWESLPDAGGQALCGVRSRAELVEIFGEESVLWIEQKARG
jgi:hypothetical protein